MFPRLFTRKRHGRFVALCLTMNFAYKKGPHLPPDIGYEVLLLWQEAFQFA
ncbi:hypothetical protein HMPREF0083_01542 [Aneurinibacillus aneurinilyticus ATCC 12856]|uniref:Uncharacterized protein n=1 Tax=Aneurinibacillus aneurinilyticus ATCC 12856 TaxID=649747 RepID=U1X5Y3_ANEAE|nr:hypothetical protein HMPREF0083_01542 [Aneurinibacillus aneurinilyticus ATCC 12856]